MSLYINIIKTSRYMKNNSVYITYTFKHRHINKWVKLFNSHTETLIDYQLYDKEDKLISFPKFDQKGLVTCSLVCNDASLLLNTI